uniref:SCAN box domain-containing protein n=1 Tax=Knipowitschia caucasica TaxID=637954 RepID=A0AAV2KRF2_KNICA
MSELVVLMKDFMQVPSGETPTETYHRLKSLYQRWVRPDQLTKEQIGELVIMEQLLRVLPPDVRTWVREHEPEDGLTAARLALQHQNARRGGPPRFTSSAPRSSQTSAPNFRVREASQDTRGNPSSASTQPATGLRPRLVWNPCLT